MITDMHVCRAAFPFLRLAADRRRHAADPRYRPLPAEAARPCRLRGR